MPKTNSRNIPTNADALMVPYALSSPRVLMPLIQASGTLANVSDRAYWLYCGQTAVAFSPQYCVVHVTGAGAGAQTAQIGIATSTGPPNKAAKTLTVVTVTGTLGALTGTGYIRNSAAFTTSIAAGAYVWAFFRTAMATTQPTCRAVGSDFGEGFALVTSTAGTLVLGSSYTGAIAAAAVQIAPEVRIELD